MKTEKSAFYHQEALHYFPGGVNSPVRAFANVGGSPLFIEKAQGPFIWDVDGNRYIDYVGSWGPAILGHADEAVIKAVQASCANGLSFGAPTKLETELARLVQEFVPSLEKMRFVSSGTEACMSALRVARGYTKRDLVLKFSGCYHGHADSFLVEAGSGVATQGIPGSPGVPIGAAADTLTAPYNDLEAVEALFARCGNNIAAVIVEPYVGNAGFIAPLPGFLPGLRNICNKYRSLLIFDEVMTGFRVAPGGAQQIVGVKPDMTTLGKVIGGGMPIAAYGGTAEIMAVVAPEGPVYQAGTLSGNPVAVSSGLETLRRLQTLDYTTLNATTSALVEGLSSLAKEHGVVFSANCQGGMFGFFFCEGPVSNFEHASKNSNRSLFKKFFWSMLERGIYFAPSPFEAGFVSFTHSAKEIDATLQAARDVFVGLR